MSLEMRVHAAGRGYEHMVAVARPFARLLTVLPQQNHLSWQPAPYAALRLPARLAAALPHRNCYPTSLERMCMCSKLGNVKRTLLLAAQRVALHGCPAVAGQAGCRITFQSTALVASPMGMLSVHGRGERSSAPAALRRACGPAAARQTDRRIIQRCTALLASLNGTYIFRAANRNRVSAPCCCPPCCCPPDWPPMNCFASSLTNCTPDNTSSTARRSLRLSAACMKRHAAGSTSLPTTMRRLAAAGHIRLHTSPNVYRLHWTASTTSDAPVHAWPNFCACAAQVRQSPHGTMSATPQDQDTHVHADGSEADAG